MDRQLLRRRDAASDRHDSALAADPTRATARFKRELQQVIAELDRVVAESDPNTRDPVEYARTLGWAGAGCFDLAEGKEPDLCARAAQYYLQAERALEGIEAPLVRAKLDFNFANTLQGQSGGTNVRFLEAAAERYRKAARVFRSLGESALEAQVRQYLDTLQPQLTLARQRDGLAGNVQKLAALRERAKQGNAAEREAVQRELRDLQRSSNPSAIEAALQQAISDARAAVEQHPEVGAGANARLLDQQVTAFRQLLRDSPPKGEPSQSGGFEQQVMHALMRRVTAEQLEGKVGEHRAQQLQRLTQQFSQALTSSDDLESLQSSAREMRALTQQAADWALDPSYGQAPKSALAVRASRRARSLLQFLISEMGRGGHGDADRKRLTQLLVRQTELDRELHEGSGDAADVRRVEKSLWQVATDVQRFARSGHVTMIQPLWRSANILQHPQSVYTTGSGVVALLAGEAQERGWTLLTEPAGGVYEVERWNQLRGADVVVAHLPDSEAPGATTARAQVCYELGIALCLGLPIVVVVAAGEAIPFDVPVETMRLSADGSDPGRLAELVEHAVFTVAWGGDGVDPAVSARTLEFTRQQVAAVGRENASEIAWRLALQNLTDATAFTDSFKRAVDMSTDERFTAAFPAWPPEYPDVAQPRCFHVTAFRDWSRTTSEVARDECQRAGVEYVRGDRTDEQRIIRAIWQELGRSTYVLVDLTEMNPNVALELGIAHTLGKRCAVVMNGNPESVFRSMRQMRVEPYTASGKFRGLREAVRRLLCGA